MKDQGKETNAAAADEGPRNFGAWFSTLSDGEAESNASAELHELMKRMNEEASARSAKVKGQLSIKVRFSVDHAGVVSVAYDIETKKPPRLTTPATYFLTPGSNLTPQNPKQKKFGFAEVAAPKKEVREPDVEVASVKET